MERRYGWEELKDKPPTLRQLNAAWRRFEKLPKPDLIIIYTRETWIFLRCGSNGTQKEKNKAGRAWDEMHEILTAGKTREKYDG